MLKRKQLLAIGTVLVLSIIGALLYKSSNAGLGAQAAKDVERQQKQLVTVAAGEIEQYFYDIQKRMETIALLPAVRDAVRSEACNKQLQQLVEVNSKELNNLGRVSKEGTFVCAVNRAIVGEPVAKYGTYFQTIASDPQHKAATSPLIYPTGSASPVVAVHVPVYDAQGGFNGTVGGAAYFDELQKRLLTGTNLSKNSLLSLYDTNLDILYSPDPLLRGKNLGSDEIKRLYTPEATFADFSAKIKQASAEGTLDYNVRGKPQHVVYKSVKAVDRQWTLAIAVPTEDYSEISSIASNQTVRRLFVAAWALLTVTAGTLAYVLPRPKTHKTQKEH